MSSGGGGQTSTTSNAPPQVFLDAYSRVNQQAQDAAATPHQTYTGQTVAQFAPDQIAAMGQIEDMTANGGIQTPYLKAAQGYVDQSANGMSPENISQFQNPYINQVVDATQAQFNNQNQQQQQQVAGSAAQHGAYGGDREAVAQAITAGQQNLAQAPVLANLRREGYQSAVQAAQQQAALRGQAGFATANLGNEALSTGLQGASARLQAGALQQQMAQTNLNVPYQNYLASVAYPYQTTGWLANIAQGLGGASGGRSSTTSPGPSSASQIAGLGAAGVGMLGSSGAFGKSGWLTGSGGSGGSGGGYVDSGTWDPLTSARGGGIPHRADGGIVDPTAMDSSTGMEPASASHGQANILKDYGSTTSQSGGGGDSTLNDILQVVGVAAKIASFFSKGGTVYPHYAMGGETPWWERSEARSADAGARHGLLESPVGGRTDHLPISPASGSYVIPADVVSGLGEGNTLAGANIVQRMLDTGPGGLKLPHSGHKMGDPRPPPVYREGADTAMAQGGGIPHLAAGGASAATTAYLAGPGINPNTGMGASTTGIAALDNYLNTTQAQASYVPPSFFVRPQPSLPDAAKAKDDALSLNPFTDFGSSGSMGAKRGGGLRGFAEGGDTEEEDDDKPLPELVVPQPGPSVPGGMSGASQGTLASQPPMGGAMQPSSSNGTIPMAKSAGYTPPPSDFAPIVQAAAEKNGIDPRQLAWLISTESGWNPKAYNQMSGTKGLGQFKDATAREVGIDPWDPVQAIHGSAVYLRKKLDQHGGDYERAIGSYGTFSTWHGAGADSAVRSRYRAFVGQPSGAPMQGSNRGGGIKRADGGATDDADNSTIGDDDLNDGDYVVQTFGSALPGEEDSSPSPQGNSGNGPPSGPMTGPPTGPDAFTGASTAQNVVRTEPVAEKADPWASLAAAGFATAAGKSPHALTNIGAGGLAGMRDYEKQQQLIVQNAIHKDTAETNRVWRMNQAQNNERRTDNYGRAVDVRAAVASANAEYKQWLMTNGNATLEQKKAFQAELVKKWGVQADNYSDRTESQAATADNRRADAQANETQRNQFRASAAEDAGARAIIGARGGSYEKALAEVRNAHGKLGPSAPVVPPVAPPVAPATSTAPVTAPGSAPVAPKSIRPPSLSTDYKLAPDGFWYAPAPGGGYIKAVPPSEGG